MEGFDLDKRLAQLESLGDPLPRLNQVVDWEAFRPLLMTIRRKPAKGPGGRPAYDVVLMFKVLVLQQLYNLADEQTEYQIRDRYSFCRFLGLSPVSKVPDARTIWVFREALKQHDLVDQLFIRLNELITAAGYIIHTKGQANRKRSKTRCRVEHVFAAQHAMGGKLVGTIGLARARVNIAIMNIVYNLRRWAWLQTMASPIQ